ncbi:MAG: hypothetical protein SWE60_12240 [Thermodesulfobacteriota bacterium]|nr:hypothetical protein [Thermodesulfobacteriota bacterium]
MEGETGKSHDGGQRTEDGRRIKGNGEPEKRGRGGETTEDEGERAEDGRQTTAESKGKKTVSESKGE